MAKQKPKPKNAPAFKHGYPRPQLQRAQWTSLNGPWDFTTDPQTQWHKPAEVRWRSTIQVPFSPETPASGVADTGFYKTCWYRRTFKSPEMRQGQRLIVHFGAVDTFARVWINDNLVVEHDGGYTPFDADITDVLRDSGEQTIIVRAYDDPHDLAKPRGKQDWQLEPHGIWYPRTTGIWQTVWLELVPPTRIGTLRWTANVAAWQIELRARLTGPLTDDLSLRVRLHANDQTLASDTYSIASGETTRTIALADPGIDDFRNALLWTPRTPNLIDADIDLLDPAGNVIDHVQSYTAMRQAEAQGERFVLNGRPCQLRFLLDQGYWPQSGLTAPNDDAFVQDIELVKSMGFNGVRKHQKIEDPRFLYWADRLGLLVWEEMPSPYRFTPESIQRLTNEWTEAIERDISHPCIIAWVPFNESWGVPDLPNVNAQRDFVSAIYHLTKALDPSRVVIGNDGWEISLTDIVAIHDYEREPSRLAQRYHRTAENLAHLFAHERPGHRQLLLDGHAYNGTPIMLTEFGGIAYHKDTQHTWGYKRAATAAEFARQYSALLASVRSIPMFAGFCYTQFTDTYQEANGLLYMDRRPKIPLRQIARFTSG